MRGLVYNGTTAARTEWPALMVCRNEFVAPKWKWAFLWLRKPILERFGRDLSTLRADRDKRFEVLKEMVEEVCRREMNLHVELLAPDKDLTLELPSTMFLAFMVSLCKWREKAYLSDKISKGCYWRKVS